MDKVFSKGKSKVIARSVQKNVNKNKYFGSASNHIAKQTGQINSNYNVGFQISSLNDAIIQAKNTDCPKNARDFIIDLYLNLNITPQMDLIKVLLLDLSHKAANYFLIDPMKLEDQLNLLADTLTTYNKIDTQIHLDHNNPFITWLNAELDFVTRQIGDYEKRHYRSFAPDGSDGSGDHSGLKGNPYLEGSPHATKPVEENK